MIRFIRLGDQIGTGDRKFAWYDTVCDCFIDLEGEQTWNCWEDFEEAHRLAAEYGNASHKLERFRALFPDERQPSPPEQPDRPTREQVEALRDTLARFSGPRSFSYDNYSPHEPIGEINVYPEIDPLDLAEAHLEALDLLRWAVGAIKVLKGPGRLLPWAAEKYKRACALAGIEVEK